MERVYAAKGAPYSVTFTQSTIREVSASHWSGEHHAEATTVSRVIEYAVFCW